MREPAPPSGPRRAWPIAGADAGRGAFLALFAALLALAAIPVLRSDILPLVDYPNHLARMYLLGELRHEPLLQRFYAIDWRPVPNLAMDATVPLLARVVPLAWAAKGFVLLTFALLAGGAAALHRVVFGRWSAWPCLAFLLLYNRLLLWGFLNYLFGAGLALWAFAAWLALRRRAVAARLGIAALFALATYFAHLMACGIYGLLVLGYEVGLLWRRGAAPAEAARALAVAAVPFVPPLALMLLATPGEATGAIAFAHPWRKLDLLFSVFDDYSRPFDIAGFVLAAGGLLFAFMRRWVRLDPAMLVPLLLLGIVYLVMPSQLFTASGVDRRLPLVLALLVIGASQWTGGRRARQVFLSAAALLFLVRLGAVAANWDASDRVYAPVLAALDDLPAGSRIAVAFPGGAVNAGAAPLVHLPTLAIARRAAFVPTLFAYATQQPVRLLPDFRALAQELPPEALFAAFTTGPPLDAAGRAALGRYDYVAFVDRGPIALADAAGLQPVFLTPRFQLYRVSPAGPLLDGTAGRR